MSRETVDALIERVLAQHPSNSPGAVARYFEAVHQELAPLARELEAENERLRHQVQGGWISAKELLATRQRAVFSCGRCGNVYRAGDQNVTIYAEDGAAKCRRCNPTTGRGGQVMTKTMEPKQ
ncbi:hypothetical protein AVME950_02355 [Acidovorax sp. SUPP950]|uniref:hypothetical protein n=1 Tax=Acidovorax sp. SUPP950 TaxID=511901 RepID=UPI0023C99786|nr:hypothetical protein [Acidovorax sp. SUPP950]GKS73689.1 hypothetical protein AVME950_02355 [Acidovorax sp. SUPP950]